MACRIILADDHTRFREELKRVLEGSPDICVVGEANDCSELFNCLARLSPDLILVDLYMPKFRGIETIPEIRRIHPGAKILVLTTYGEEAYISRTLAAGADGYLLKEHAYEELFPAIKSIQNGSKYVSPILGLAGTPILLR